MGNSSLVSFYTHICGRDGHPGGVQSPSSERPPPLGMADGELGRGSHGPGFKSSSPVWLGADRLYPWGEDEGPQGAQTLSAGQAWVCVDGAAHGQKWGHS